MRYLPDVVEQILAVIPETEIALINSWNSIRQSALFAAPENMNLHWNRGGELLSDNFPDAANLNEWQTKIIKIWMNL